MELSTRDDLIVGVLCDDNGRSCEKHEKRGFVSCGQSLKKGIKMYFKKSLLEQTPGQLQLGDIVQ